MHLGCLRKDRKGSILEISILCVISALWCCLEWTSTGSMQRVVQFLNRYAKSVVTAHRQSPQTQIGSK